MGIFIVPMGSFLIGVTFILRDIVQNSFGRTKTYLVIGSALVLSAFISYVLGDSLWITFASAVTFALSETVDTEVYSRLKASFTSRVVISGVLGGTVDSIVFVIVGLSPFGANMIPWSLVIFAIIGQILVKSVMQALGGLIIFTFWRR
jgi:uncharacterized PurR-regulated membrane protein YhhQ (DUF165 family)